MGRVPLAPPMRFGTAAFPPPWIEHEQMEDGDHHQYLSSYSQCLYRGAFPKHRNLPFLATLHLRTIVSLTPKPLDSDAGIVEWASRQNNGQGIRMVHVRTEKPKEDTGGLTREGAARAMLELLHRDNLPLYVHCLDGVEATSTLIACLRKIQGWSDPSIRMEFAREILIAPNRLANSPYGIPKHLTHFLEHYGEPDGVHLPPPDCIPSWVWPTLALGSDALGHSRSLNAAFRHPSLRIHFQRGKGEDVRSSSKPAASSRSKSAGKVWSRLPRRLAPSSAAMDQRRLSDSLDGASESLSEVTEEMHTTSSSTSDIHDRSDPLRVDMHPSSAEIRDTSKSDTPRLYPVSTCDSLSIPTTPNETKHANSSQNSTPIAQPAETYKLSASEVLARDLQQNGENLYHEPRQLPNHDSNWIEQLPPADSESDPAQALKPLRESSQTSREHNVDDTSERISQVHQLNQDQDQHLADDDDLGEFTEEDDEFHDEEEDPSQVLDALDLEGY